MPTSSWKPPQFVWKETQGVINKQEGSGPIVPQAGVGWRMPTRRPRLCSLGPGILGGGAQGQVDSCQASGSSQAGRPGLRELPPGVHPGALTSMVPLPAGWPRGWRDTLLVCGVAAPIRGQRPWPSSPLAPLGEEAILFLALCLVAEGPAWTAGFLALWGLRGLVWSGPVPGSFPGFSRRGWTGPGMADLESSTAQCPLPSTCHARLGKGLSGPRGARSPLTLCDGCGLALCLWVEPAGPWACPGPAPS